MAMDPEKLYVTIHPEDTEAYDLWHDLIGLEESRIIRIEGNFWDIGKDHLDLTLKYSTTEATHTEKKIQLKKCIQVEKMNVI